MRRCVLFLLTASLLADEPFPERVNEAIERGVAALRKQQRDDGSWGSMGGRNARTYEGGSGSYMFPAGPTALALLTLLKCGVPADDPAVAKGFAFLDAKYRIPKSAYEISVLIMAIEARANPYKRDRVREIDLKKAGETRLVVKLRARERRWMRELMAQLKKRATKGGWRYGGGIPDPFGVPRDVSSTQYAMMALYVAKRCGVKPSKRLVRDAIRYCLEQQHESGGWSYVKGSTHTHEGLASGTMTTGGIVILETGRSILGKIGGRLGERVDAAVERGLAWLAKNWTVEKNPAAAYAPYHLMYLYGLERVGDLLRITLIGGHDWYREGALWLLKHQRSGGSWWVRDTHAPRETLNTCFALLFLDRATLTAITRAR